MCPRDVPSGTGTANAATVTTGKRFELPEYTPTNPELWFLTCETIFEDYDVTTEKKKFSAILQRLGMDQITTLESIVRQKPADPYTQARARLIAADGQSEDERVNRLLRGADIPTGTRPCVILQRLRALVGTLAATDEEADRLVRPIWLQKLPIRTQEVLQANRLDPLDSLCKTADRLHELAERPGAVCAVSTDTKTSANDSLATALRLLTSEIAALRAERTGGRARERSRDRSRDRDRSHSRYSRRPRSRSQTPYREQATDMIDGICWYHHTFGERARNCAPGCKRAPLGNEK